MNWQFLPFDGIECGGIKISFGQARGVLRESMASGFRLRQNDGFPDEDDFVSRDGSTLIRVRYQDEAVWDIEFLSGILRYDDEDLHDQTTLDDVRQFLESKALALRPTEWLGEGWDCVPLGFNIASHEDVGGDGDEIEWVILSRAFQT